MGIIVHLPRRHARASSEAISSLRAASPASTSSVTSGTSRSAAKATTPAQCGAGMPRVRQPLTVDSDCASAPATVPVPPRAKMTESQLSMPRIIVRSLRTCQPFATCEATNSRISGIIRSVDTDLEISNRLASLREKLGLDQVAFARALGIEKNTYNAYERGKRPLTIETAKKIRKRYGISVDWLLFGDVGQPNHEFILEIPTGTESAPKSQVRKKRTASLR